jgi:hypothetical protein
VFDLSIPDDFRAELGTYIIAIDQLAGIMKMWGYKLINEEIEA